MRGTNPKNFEDAKQAAQRIYKRVNFDGGNLQSYELSSLLQQTYDFLKIPYKPSTNDLKEYAKVLDANGDGAVSLQDLQTLAVQYLCGDGVLSSVGGSQVGNKYLQSQYSSSSYQNNQSSDYVNYGSGQTGQRSSNVSNEGVKNYTGYSQYSSGSQYNEQGYTSSMYNQQGVYQQQNGLKSNNFTSSGVGGNNQYGGSYNNSSASNNSSGQQFGSNKNVSGNPYLNSQGYSGVAQTQQHLASKQFNQSPVISEPKSKYTPIAQNYLNITRSLFAKYSNRQTNTITRDKVASLLNETYSALGRKGYHPSEEDVNVWMKLCDTNSDGHVQEAEYEYFVVRALERSGVQVNA